MTPPLTCAPAATTSSSISFVSRKTKSRPRKRCGRGTGTIARLFLGVSFVGWGRCSAGWGRGAAGPFRAAIAKTQDLETMGRPWTSAKSSLEVPGGQE